MTDEELKKALKEVFFYHPFGGLKDSENHNVICTCGKPMKMHACGSSYSEGDAHFECTCGKKLFLVYEFVNDFPKGHDKTSITIKKCNCKGCKSIFRLNRTSF